MNWCCLGNVVHKLCHASAKYLAAMTSFVIVRIAREEFLYLSLRMVSLLQKPRIFVEKGLYMCYETWIVLPHLEHSFKR